MASMLRAKWKKWDILDTAIEREGWKLLLLLRLSPMVPYNLLNIAMATTKMHFVTFSVVSAFGEILLNPQCSMYYTPTTRPQTLIKLCLMGNPEIWSTRCGIQFTSCVMA